MVAAEEDVKLEVVKRNGRKVEWDETKVALAIKKGFDSISLNEDETKYTEKDINKVYNKVIDKIKKDYKDKIKIEEIQDIIEAELKKGYEDVYESFKEYRERRNASRQIFFGEKKQHKFLKAIESLGLKSASEEDAKRENANVDGDTAMGTMLQYGSTVSKEFALYKREQVFEQVRKEQFNDLPSRQKCIWLTDEENLEYWKTMSTEEKCLLTLELQEEKMICCDESWLYIDTFLDDEYERRARNYWTGSVSNAPHLEYLFYGTAIVKNIERI